MMFTVITDPEKEQRPTSWKAWRDTVITQIKFKPDRERVEKEWTAKLTLFDTAGTSVRSLTMPWHTR